MADWVLGVDLGTTNSAVAVADGGQVKVLADADGHRLIPSVVSFHPDGTVLTGDLARERRLIDAKNTVYSVKRLIGRPYTSKEVETARKRFAFDLVEGRGGVAMVQVRAGTFTLAEISAFVLREIRRVADQMLGATCTRAVITVPANFNELQRSATRAAGRVAGLQVLRILNEPTAAALAYGYGREKPERIAVYDFGGGTFDLSILEIDGDVVEVIATAGDTFLGGDDIDLAITDAMVDTFLRVHRVDLRQDPQAFERLRGAAEWVKCQLSTGDETEVSVPELAHGEGGRDLNLVFRLSRRDLELRIRPLLERSFDICSEAMREASFEPTDIDQVVLVGGSTRVPLVRRLVRDYFGREPRTEIDPDLVVAQGAAIQGHALAASQAPKALGRIGLVKRTVAEIAAADAKREKALVGRPEQPAFAPREAPGARSPKVHPPRSAAALQSVPNLPVPTPPPLGLLVPLVLDRVPSTRPPPEEGAWDDGGSGAAAGTEVAVHPQEQAPRSEPPVELDDSDLEPQHAESEDGIDALPAPAAHRPRPIVEEASVVIDAAYAASLEPGGLLQYRTDQTITFDIVPGAELDASPDAALDAIEPPPVAVSETPVAPAPAKSRPVLGMAPRPAPLLMDVTPQTLAIETAGGYCRAVVRRNAPIPAEQTRRFTTGQDGQEAVRVRICQGEQPRFGDNQLLGEVVLDGLAARKRGEVNIDVLFLLDANGTLDVRATDAETGREQAIRIQLQGGLSDDEIAAMTERQRLVLGEGP